MENHIRKFMILCLIIIFGYAVIDTIINVNYIDVDSNSNKLNKVKEDISSKVEDIDNTIHIDDIHIKGNSVSKEETIEIDKLIEEDECIDTSNPIFDKNINIIDRINNYLGNDKSSTSFMYYNLVTKETISFNEDLYMDAASLYKVGLGIVVYNMINNDEIRLEDLVYYSPWQYQGGTGILQYDLTFGALPVSTLVEYSIKYSDNIAATMLYSYIGGWSNFKFRLFEILGIDYGDYNNVTSARIELEVLKYIYENRNNPNYNTLIEYLKNTEFHDRLDKYLPKDIVAHKIGSNEGYTHDIGIIFTEDPYIIIMMTDNVYNSPDKIADISKEMYLYNIGNTKIKIRTPNHEFQLK